MTEQPLGPARDRRGHFDAWAAYYDEQLAGEPEEFPFLGYHRVLHAAADEVARRRPARVVDLGVGTGNLAALIAARLPQAAIVGLDYSADMLEAARAKLPPGATLLQARLEVDELPTGPLHGAGAAAATCAARA